MSSIKEHFICPNCGKSLAANFFPAHMRKEHNASEVEIMLFQMRHSSTYEVEEIPDTVLKPYLERVYVKVGKLERYKMYLSQFKSFYKSIILCHEWEGESDFDLFFNSVLPWKLNHPNQANNKELCEITYPNNKEFADKMYHDLMLVKNPYYKHDGSLSPFSKDFIGYKNLNEDEKAQKIAEAVKLDVDGRQSTTVEYWMQRKGLSEDEAKAKLKDRQTTFSKEKCIQKYGVEEGLKVWKARQEKWLNSYKKQNFSKISQELFWDLYNQIQYTCYFATNVNGEKMDDGINHEYCLTLSNKSIKPDFFIPELKLIIEFDGDYWHGMIGNKKRELERDNMIKSEGYHILHVKEYDYRHNQKQVIETCIDFINECKQNRKENEII